MGQKETKNILYYDMTFTQTQNLINASDEERGRCQNCTPQKKKKPIQIKNIHPILISSGSWQPTGLKPNKKA